MGFHEKGMRPLMMLLPILLISLLPLEADSPDVEWSRTYESSGEALFVQETSDGGYIVAGWTNSSGGYANYVIKLSPESDRTLTVTKTETITKTTTVTVEMTETIKEVAMPDSSILLLVASLSVALIVSVVFTMRLRRDLIGCYSKCPPDVGQAKPEAPLARDEGQTQEFEESLDARTNLDSLES